MEPEIIEFLEQSNYIEGEGDDALEDSIDAWEYLMTRKIMTPVVVLETHRLLMKTRNLPAEHHGRFRTVPVYIGGHEAMNSIKIPEAIGDWCNNTMKSRWSAKKLHIAYEKIHPFIDGNGRTGRMFLNWTRLKKGQPILIIKESEKFPYYNWFK